MTSTSQTSPTSPDQAKTGIPASAPPPRQARHAFTVLLWTYALTITRFALAFSLSVVLARLLGPGPFGLVAVALLVVGPGMLLVEAGAGAALIQRPELDEDVVASAFTWQLLAGATLSASTAVAAPFITTLLQTPSATPVVRAMAPAFFLQSLGLVSTALLRRELRHRDVLLVGTVSYALSYGGLGLPLALAGAGVWALVAAQLTQALGASIGLLTLRPHRWRLRAPWSDRELTRFSNQVMRVNGLNWMIENGDNIVIGRLFGAVPLGLYSRAYSAVRLPADALLTAVQSVSFAGQSRVTDARVAGRAYVATLNAISLAALPLFATTAALGPLLVEGLYGPRWHGAAALVRPLSLALGFHCLVAVAGPVLWARNRVRLEYGAQLASLAVFAGSLVLLSDSVVHVAWAVAIAYITRGVLMTVAVARMLDLDNVTQLGAALSGSRSAALAGLGAALVAQSHLPAPTSVALGLLQCGAIAAAVPLALRRTEWTQELRETVALLGIPLLSGRASHIRTSRGAMP